MKAQRQPLAEVNDGRGASMDYERAAPLDHPETLNVSFYRALASPRLASTRTDACHAPMSPTQHGGSFLGEISMHPVVEPSKEQDDDEDVWLSPMKFLALAMAEYDPCTELRTAPWLTPQPQPKSSRFSSPR